MAKRISFSFLGTGAYRSTDYFFPATSGSEDYTTPLVQLAIQRYLEAHEHFGYNDRHVLLLTDTARKRNYLAAVKPYDADAPAHKGLKAELVECGFKTPTKPVPVPAGHDRESIVHVFDTIVNEVGTGDEVFIDITHGFRSLPMLALVLANFLRVAKQARIRAVFYGAFDDREEHGGRAPIYDLSYFMELQEWSTAAYGYLEYGFVEPLMKLSSGELSGLLRATRGQHVSARAVSTLIKNAFELAKQVRTNRGYELYVGEAADSIQEQAGILQGDSVVERGPMQLLMERIAAKSVGLQKNGKLNWLRAARLAFDDGLVQQTCSLLREGAVSYVCQANDLSAGRAADRALVEKALNAVGGKVEKSKWDPPSGTMPTFIKITESTSALEVNRMFYALSPYRNDLMHAGYYTEEGSDNARGSDRIINMIEKALIQFEQALLT